LFERMLLDSAHARHTRRVLRDVPSTPTRRPTATAVVPSFNYARFLPDAVTSLLTQRDVEVQVIVVDDGSTDDTPQTLAHLQRAHGADRLHVIRNAPNLGQLPSVNQALARVNPDTDYVLKFDADDVLAPGALARAAALLDAHPDTAFTYGRVHHFTGVVPAVPDAPAESWTLWDGQTWIANRCADATNVISQPEVVIRAAALKEAGPIREDLPHTFDLHLWLRLAAIGAVGRVNGPAQGLYRVHDASLQRTVHAGVVLDLRERLAAFEALIADGTIDTAHRARIRQAIATQALDRACRAYDRGRTHEEPVDALVALALEVHPRAEELPAWRVLEHRRKLGPSRAQRHPRSLTAALKRRAAERRAHRRWSRTGEW
jgi:hypothetical protein